jgi:very-short-patch-repair endonuclease
MSKTTLDLVWGIYGIEAPQAEYRFHEIRRWRFDFAWVGRKIAVEIDGGLWIQGRHSRGAGFIRDLEKFNEATRLGWRVYHFTPRQLRQGEAQAFMKQVLI